MREIVVLVMAAGCSLTWGGPTPETEPDAGSKKEQDPDASSDAAADAMELVPDAPTPIGPIPSSGTFGAQTAYATGNEPAAIVTADFNGDGRPDIAVSNVNNQGSQIANIGSVSVFLTMPGGMLQAAQSYTVGYAPEGIAAGDFNGDSAIDLVTTNVGYGMGGNITVLLGNGNGTFGSATAYSACCSPQGIAVGDLNSDGKPDLAIANYQSVQILLGNGNGGFGTPVSYTTPGAYSIALGDLNGDGKLDVVVGYGNTQVPEALAVMMNNGNGTLAAAVLYANKGLSTLALADLDLDGKLDVITANRATQDISVLRGTGSGTLMTAQFFAIGLFPTWIVAEDFNGDGKVDIAVTDVDASNVNVRLGNGDATFQTTAAYATASGAGALATADFDLDGRADLASANGGTDNVSVLLGLP